MKQEIACSGPKGNVVLHVESIPFSEIPGQSRLFTEYQNDPAAKREFYPNVLTSHTQVVERIPEVLA
ncbi:MAG TPA: hypothetical protein VL327_12020, partial [Pyrinomonadaceae bacterium]|nr:hypothetical protein [Pyrinomonadaceae bacterium]